MTFCHAFPATVVVLLSLLFLGLSPFRAMAIWRFCDTEVLFEAHGQTGITAIVNDAVCDAMAHTADYDVVLKTSWFAERRKAELKAFGPTKLWSLKDRI
jgi:hypothetical protein